MLNEPESGSTEGTGTGGGTEPAQGPPGGLPPGTMALQVTPQEKEAIDRVSH